MKEETNGRNLPSKVRCGFLLTGLLVAMGVAARAQGRPDAASGGCPEAAANPARVAPAEVPGLWAQVFPEGTSAAGLAEETADGGFVFSGWTTAAGVGGLDQWLLKMDASGTVVWQEAIGTAQDDGAAILASPSGGFLAQGGSGAAQGFWLAKLDDSGALQWQEQVGLPPGRGVIARAFPQEAGSVLTGTAINPFFHKITPVLVRLDDAGSVLWQWTYHSAVGPGAGGNDYLFGDVTPFSKGGFAVSGTRVSAQNGDSDLFLLATDADGHVLWQGTYGTAGNDLPVSLIRTEDGGFLYEGMSAPAPAVQGSEPTLLLLRLDSTGGVLWQRIISAAGGLTGVVTEDPSGGVLLSGTVTSLGGGSSDLWAVHLDAAGNLLWQKNYGGPGPEEGLVLPDPLGGYLLQGTSAPDGQTMADLWVAKLDDAGSVVWQRLYGGADAEVGSVARLAEGDLLLNGSVTDVAGTATRCWTARLDETGGPEGDCAWIHTASLPSQDGQLEITEPLIITSKPDLTETAAVYSVNGFGAAVAVTSFSPEVLCTVNRVLIATAEADVTAGIEPLTVQFTGRASGGAGGYTFHWTFGDGGVSDRQNPSHEYGAAGDYPVTLTVSDSSSQTVSDGHLLIHVTALAPLVPSASADVTSGTVPLTVHFTGSATGGLPPYTYAWAFGDGGTSTAQNPSHAYASAGSFSAVLTVSDSFSSTVSAPAISITAYTPLVASASAEVTSGTVPLTVHFTGSATGGLAPYTYSWTFGDGGTSTSQNPSHEYASAGGFSAVLTVGDSLSHSVSAPAITVTVFAPLTASASVDVVSGTAPLTVHFSGAATGGLPPYTYAWTFGDGGILPGQGPSHEYAAPGTYPVSLTVTDSASHSAADTHLTITVEAPVPPPVVTLIKKVSPPFKLVVTGANLQDHIRVFINGTEWTSVVWKTTTKIQLTGAIKTAVPKGVPTTFQFLNPDGGEVTTTWSR